MNFDPTNTVCFANTTKNELCQQSITCIGTEMRSLTKLRNTNNECIAYTNKL